MKAPLLCALCLPLLLTTGCITKTTSSPDFGHDNIRQGAASQAWMVFADGQVQGYAIRFQEVGGQGEVHTSIRNPHNQDLGWVDSEGRAWRYRLHGDPEWLGTGTLLKGALSILELDLSADLVPIPFEDVP